MKNKKLAEKEFDKLIEEMTKYVSVMRKERPPKARHWNISNKYRVNHGATF